MSGERMAQVLGVGLLGAMLGYALIGWKTACIVGALFAVAEWSTRTEAHHE